MVKLTNDDLTGQRFSRLSVMKREMVEMWLCECECGTRTMVRRPHLLNGMVQSCGCHRRATTVARNLKHGYGRRGSKPPEYQTWVNIRSRCNNPKATGYENYGGRGIKVCERWGKFVNFLADMGPKPTPRHSIEREDNEKGYSPENCRWATRIEQRANQRENHRMVTFQGARMPAFAAADLAGLPRQSVYCRLSIGWDDERALTQPLRPRRRTSAASLASK